MWAGGTVLYNPSNELELNNTRAVCVEGIRDVTVKGQPGSEKVFVGIERRVGRILGDEDNAFIEAQRQLAQDQEGRQGGSAAEAEGQGIGAQRMAQVEDRIRQRLWQEKDDDFGPDGECSIIERRNIVFMRDHEAPKSAPSSADSPDQPKKQPKMLKPTYKPNFFDHTIIPDAKLLFRFSALTFNAHAIHLDPEYCRNVEGHRNLLFHGPLSYTFLVTLLRRKIEEREREAAQKGRSARAQDEPEQHAREQATPLLQQARQAMDNALGTGGQTGGANLAGHPEEVITKVEYRNLAPLYCGEKIRFCCYRDEADPQRYEIWAETPQGGIAVKGTAWLKVRH